MDIDYNLEKNLCQGRDYKRRASETYDEEKSPSKRHRAMFEDPLHCQSLRIPELSSEPLNREETASPTNTLVYDACFGTVQINASILSCLGGASPVLTVHSSGPLLKLSTTKPVKHVGIIMAPKLSELTRNFRVTLRATLAPVDGKRVKGVDKPATCSQRPVRILVYGFCSEQDNVAKALSQGDFYLQDPLPDEIDARVSYQNPQYFLRPGATMPTIAEFALSENTDSPTAANILSKSEKAWLLQIFQTETKKIDMRGVKPSQRIISSLEEHQLAALAFMIEKELGRVEDSQFPALWTRAETEGQTKYHHVITGQCEEDFPSSLYGGVLADEMGLGKTLATLALICWHLDASDDEPSALVAAESRISRQTLIVAPNSAIHQWQEQIKAHLKPGRLHYLVYHGPNRQQISKTWNSQDIILTTYGTIRSDWQKNGPLLKNSWARVVLDEAHTIRNRASDLFQATCAIRAQHRWCLTGTPIHNRLDDFGALLTFLRVPPFCTRQSFEKWVARPIETKQRDAVGTLRKLVLATCLRRTKQSIHSTLKLPRKTEKAESVVLDEGERALYSFFQRGTFFLANGSLDDSNSTLSATKRQAILPLIGILRLICNHGHHLLPQPALAAWKLNEPSQLFSNAFSAMVEKCIICNTAIEYTGDMDPTEFPCSHLICAACDNADESAALDTTKHDYCPKCRPEEGSLGIAAAAECDDIMAKTQYKASTKVESLIRNLRSELFQPLPSGETKPFKSVVFSYWTKMLDLVQIAFRDSGFSFTRIDGRTPLPRRIQALRNFHSDPGCQIMLASIGSIGEGVDLTAANYIHILEPQWNPMAEAQAVDRVHRIGQGRDVVITRYSVQDSIEDYVRWIQKEKLALIEQSLSASDPGQQQLREARWKVLLEALK